MTVKFLITFSILSLVNVIFSTVKSITTIKCGRKIAPLIAGGYYSFYNIIIIYTVADFSLAAKCIITFVANVLGTYIVKFVEEKLEKDRLWIYDTICKEPHDQIRALDIELKESGIKRVYTELIPNELYTMKIFSNNKDQSKLIKHVLENYNVNYHAYETKEA